jgi:hypothetical protein
MQCNETSTTTGKQCQRDAEPGKLICVIHRKRKDGSFTPSNTRARGREKEMRDEMRARYFDVLADPEHLFDLNIDIALLETRLRELISRVHTHESERAWKKLADQNDALRVAWRKHDDEEIMLAMRTLSDLIEEGQSDYAAWGEIHEILKTRTRITTQERKIRLEEKRLLPAEQVDLLLKAILNLVRENVEDSKALANIHRGYLALTGAPERPFITTTARIVGQSEPE